MGTTLVISLTIGAFVATVISEGTLLPILIAAGGALAGFNMALYNFEKYDDIYDIAKAQKMFKKDLITREMQEQAKFNYIMGWLNLVLAGLDVMLVGVNTATALRNLSILKKLAGAHGAEILAKLKPKQILQFEEALQLQAKGKLSEANAIRNELMSKLGDDYSKAELFFNRNRELLVGGKYVVVHGEKVLIPGPVRNRINIRMGDPEVKGSGLKYAMKRHGGSGPNNKSQFSINEKELIEILNRNDVIYSKLNISETSGNYYREVDIGYVIGKLPKDWGEKPTSIITIITDEKGNLVNTFPGRLYFD